MNNSPWIHFHTRKERRQRVVPPVKLVAAARWRIDVTPSSRHSRTRGWSAPPRASHELVARYRLHRNRGWEQRFGGRELSSSSGDNMLMDCSIEWRIQCGALRSFGLG